jgi:hypothetical protein
LVAPMASSELAATASASVPIYPTVIGVRLLAGVYGAVPILDDTAAPRADLRLGALFGGSTKTSVELHLPIAGDPSTLKLVVELSVALR